MIHIDKSVLIPLANAPNDYTIKIFFFIATNQPEEGIFGYQTTKEQLAIDLKENRTSIFRAIKWLKDKILIQELKLVEASDFMCNPRWIMNNSDYAARKAEWDRRGRLDIERDLRLKKERRIRKLRKEKNQKN